MTRSITYNGQTQYKPGAITKINAKALAPIGLNTNGIVALIGEADGGAPGATGGVVTMDDPVLAKEYFRSGDLADAVRLAFDPSNDTRIPGGAFRVLAYKVNQSTQSTVQLPGDEAFLSDTAAGTPTTTVIELTTNTSMVVNAHVGRWLKFPTTGTTELRKIVSNTADTITVSPGFSSAPVATNPVQIMQSQLILTSADYGAHTEQIATEFEAGVTSNTWVMTNTFEDETEQTDEILGKSAFRIKYVGGPVEDSGTVDKDGDTTGATVKLDVASAPALDDWAGMYLRLPGGIQRLILSNSAADPSVITFASGHYLSTAEQADISDGVTTGEVINVTQANASITGASGVATGFSTAVLPTADDLSITFTTNQTLRSFVDQINATTNYEAEITPGVNGDTTLMNTFDFGTRATSVDVRFDDQITPNDKGSFRRDLQDLIDIINAQSSLVTASRATAGSTEGSEIPAATGGAATVARDVPIYLSGGARGISINSNWQAGFDELLLHRANHVVPLISQDLTNQGNSSTATFASVAAMLSSHVDVANSSGKSERGGYIGMAGTKNELITQAAQFNNADIMLSGEKHTVLNVDGDLTEQEEWSAAVLAAGHRAGVSNIGEPLTFKFMKTFGVSRDTSWDPKNITDVNQLLAGGVLFSEAGPNGGQRWVRDITTYLIDDNIAFMDGNTRDVVRYVAYEFRTDLENTFTGSRGIPATVANIRERSAAKLQAFYNDEIIVDSLDPEDLDNTTTIIPGWRRLRVSMTGNVASVKVEIFPVTGIVFETIEIFLQLPRLVA